MKIHYKLFCLVIVTHCFSLALAENDDECTSGSAWKTTCNWCSCSHGKPACSRKMCIPGLKIEPECKGESRWKEDCNWCQCVDGKPQCEEKFCGSLTESDRKGKSFDTVYSCQEGSTWQHECQECTCIGQIVWCSDSVHCQEKEKKVQQRIVPNPTKFDCINGSRWRNDGCNWCSCVEGSAMCTLMACQGLNTDEPMCMDGSRWKEDCNWCHCFDGTVVCSSKSCQGLKPGDECVEGSRFQKQCNWCSCMDGKAACTKRMCPSTAHQKEILCEGESRWKKDDCNWCSCVQGKGVCTNAACIDEGLMMVHRKRIQGSLAHRKAKSNTTSVCVEGSRYYSQCNWCTCLNGHYSCTERACIGGKVDQYEGKCEGGARWKKDQCNWCNCVDGQGVCTNKACIDSGLMAIHEKRKKNQQVQEVKNDDQECTDGSRFRKQCNWCNCLNGKPVCTKRLCPGPVDPLGNACEGESRWKKDKCNWCNCVDGKGVCTNKACLDDDLLAVHQQRKKNQESKTPEVEKECTEGSRFRKQCNWCRCLNGLSVCSKKLCRGPADPQADQCEGESKWKKDKCNWCSCVNGKALCTQKACIDDDLMRVHEERQKLEDEGRVCANGSRYKKDCNWCSCVEGFEICTLKECAPGFQPTKDVECDGSSLFKRDCNWCNCVNGLAVCTKKLCNINIQQEEYKIDTHVQCLGSSEWRDDCNWCHCVGGFPFCTKILCIPNSQKNTSEPECLHDAHWKKDCNWCRCHEGKAVCTKRLCAKHPPLSTSTNIGVLPHITPLKETKPTTNEKPCINGTRWTDDCNDCVCANNRGVCTKKLCIDKLTTPKEPQCSEGEVWKKDCNTCRCHNGVNICTQRACIQSNQLPHAHSRPPICFLPPIKGDNSKCDGSESKWTYNSLRNICEKITLQNCDGVQNAFDSQSDCQLICGNKNSAVEENTDDKKVGRSEHCFLAKDPGPCFGFFERFAFNPDNNRCEMFHYGGCQGNDNNFASAESCFKICGGDIPVRNTSCDRSKCDWHRLSHYFAKRCTPIYEEESCCPTRFNCKSEVELNMQPDKCYYNHKEYNISTQIEMSAPCDKSCRCISSHIDASRAYVNCAIVECPSLFQPPLPPGCRRIYAVDKCCEIAKDCESNKYGPYADLRSVTCSWDGNMYQGGDKITFRGRDSCQTCICNDKFSGPYGPGCRRLDCGMEFRHRIRLFKGCVPIYYETSCCPVDWLCPGSKLLGVQVIEPKITENQAPVATQNECVLGIHKVPIGSFANTTDCRIKCQCLVPPDLTCVKSHNCPKTENLNLLEDDTCPINCKSMVDEAGKQTCRCNERSFKCPEVKCPPECRNQRIVLDKDSGCQKCECECPKDPRGNPPCPQDCAVKYVENKKSGCKECKCV